MFSVIYYVDFSVNIFSVFEVWSESRCTLLYIILTYLLVDECSVLKCICLL